ncbi:filamentous hemagglutinin family protein [Achromobacter deleyi]|uniref:Filamentous hemagglutinin family protein n=2 Tax=Pseudomonadota TaxID=1224 RepID=A0A7T4E3W9_9BURK|nr:filamentous haemagglutinin family protein [Achromobacter deleyi]QQB35150.1 filamentous hemagglutinin family protein [Achromobacter deleyi]
MSSSTSVPPAVRATSSLVPPSSRPLRAARRRALGARSGWRLRPLSQALAVLALAGGWSGAAHAQARAFSSSWFADKNAVQSTAQRTGRMPDGSLAGIGTSARQQAEARQQLRHSLDNLNRTAAAVAAQQAAQAAARAAAANGGGVPDGLVEGGLWEARGALAKWEGAKAAKPGTEDGRQIVTIEQTQSRAILNWDTFNVGRNTTLRFQQNSGDAVLNRVVGASARPSEIHGAIKADGTVLVVNQNGVIFTGTSQVNVRNLVAAAATITDTQFRDKGLYADADGTQPTFKDALGQVRVLAGARIETAAPASATQGGGYVLLLGSEVHNAGAIHTPRGQAALAAGDDFYIRKGYGTDVNLRSTTQGNEISTAIKAGSSAGLVSNTGLITAPTGDITLTGRTVRQDGVLLTTTDIGARGAIHLLNRAGDANGSITLGASGVTAVLLEASAVTGLDGQRDAAIKALDGGIVNKTGGVFDNLSTVRDRSDLSRIEIVTGNLATFAGGSTTVATGGQIAVSAKTRSVLESGAELDVAGAIGVRVAMEANNLAINIQGNEQRDAPANRDSKLLNSNDVWVDRRTLVRVAAGNGYTSDRWYTAGGLLEVSGYLATSGRSAAEWLAQGGTATFTGGELTTLAGSNINLSGGTLDVQDGFIRQIWLRGADGRLYDVSRAPGDLLYTGLYKGFEQTHARWGEKATRTFYNPLIAPRERFENGYTVGRDAGQLIVSTNRANLAGALTGEVYQGSRQTEAPQADMDGYYQSQAAVARRGRLVVGSYLPQFDTASNMLAWRLTGQAARVTVGTGAAGADEIRLDDAWLNAADLGGLRLAGKEAVTIDAALQFAMGGNVQFYAPQVAINAGITAAGGRIEAGNITRQISGNNRVEDDAVNPPAGQRAGVSLAPGAVLDVSGRWTNLSIDPSDSAALAYRNGGTVVLRSTGDVALAAGSRIDVSGGAGLLANGKTRNGRGGDLTLVASAASSGGRLLLDGELAGYGVEGGGKLTLQAERVRIVTRKQPGNAGAATETVLAGADFSQGFSQYEVIGALGVEVEPGAELAVSMPVLRYDGNARATLDKAVALPVWTPALYQEDPVKSVLTQRKGASLTLQAGTPQIALADVPRAALRIGEGARVQVDPGQKIDLLGAGQITVNGVLSAWGGRISANQLTFGVSEPLAGGGHDLSIWIGEQGVLDVAARAATAINRRGETYGRLQDGGAIVLGGPVDLAKGLVTAPDLFVVLRPGSRLDASGAAANLLVNGTPTELASAGGAISISSGNGLYLDGQLSARAGGAGAAAGALTIGLDSPNYLNRVTRPRVLAPRDFVLSAQQAADALDGATDPATLANKLAYGRGAFSVAQLQQGGFGDLTLLSNGLLTFDGDVNLRMNQSLRLIGTEMALSERSAAQARVSLAAPYVLLAGSGVRGAPDGYVRAPLSALPSTRASASVFRVDAGFIDLRDGVVLGGLRSQRASPGAAATFTGRGFSRAELVSQGDIRLLAGAGSVLVDPRSPYTTQLSVPGDLFLSAAQIYPATGAAAQIVAGQASDGSGRSLFDPGSRITIARSTAVAPDAPYSVFGRLRLGADIIEQGGVLRAPLGLIELGIDGNEKGATSLLKLLPGSITSSSARGLVMPYGGTIDGINYKYVGNDVTLVGVGASRDSGELGMGVALAGKSVSVQASALIDLSGGGDLRGAGFVSGRGGSTDARFNPLVQINAQGGGFTLPGLATNPVYALVPGNQAAVAPYAPDAGASQPLAGQRVTIGAGVPGLPAGTYTLMPSTYALLPGAFRVEINGAAAGNPAAGAQALRNGSWAIAGSLGINGTDVASAIARQLIVTSGQTLRQYSQYNEMDYAAFVRADAARRGLPRALLPADASTLKLLLARDAPGQPFSFNGRADFSPATGGYGGTFAVVPSTSSNAPLEITAPGAGRTPGFTGLSIDGAQLNAVNAPRLSVGATPFVDYKSSGTSVGFGYAYTRFGSITVRSGAALSAAEIFLTTNTLTGGIDIERGATLNTIGRGRAPYDSRDGYSYGAGTASLLAVSNGWLDVLPPAADQGANAGAGPIRIGTCGPAACAGEALIYTEGTLAAATNKAFDLGVDVGYGARYLTLAVGAINAGTQASLAAAAARGVLGSGLSLDQSLLNRLLAGDARFGAPALEMLTLSVADAFNFYGTVTLDALDPATGKPRLKTLALTAPALYGDGQAGDVATLRAGELVWNGSTRAAPGLSANGAGTGRGTLNLEASRIEFGYGAYTQPQNALDNARLALGFGTVNLVASDRISANNQGSLGVYESRGAYDAKTGWQYLGGNLNLVTPLLTGESGSVNRLRAGGRLTLSQPAAMPTAAPTTRGLGAELSLEAGDLRIDGRIALPTGKLTLRADGNVALGANAVLDLAGRPVPFDDVTKYSWGGDAIIESRHGNVTQAAGGVIDLSARYNRAGRLTVTALDANAGVVDLQGRILGSASGDYDAGGTYVPYAYGAADIRARVMDFAGLNRRLNEGEVFGGRSFRLAQGDLVIGDELRAREINVSVDNGSLTVTGRIDASGAAAGSIRLAAANGLRLASNAVLDTHGTLLRVDSYGKIIDAPNRAVIELNAGNGTLRLDAGARMDLRAGTDSAANDGRPRGTVELNAPRLGGATGGDIDIDARGPLDIHGARSIAVNGVWVYKDAPAGTEVNAGDKPYQVIDQAYLERLHGDSRDFITHALANGNLLDVKLAGLRAYADALHLRPGVEIRSTTADGDLVVQGDIDLSRYRYASINPHTPFTAVYGSGEVANLVIRAGGDLQIHGSINDGFAPPPSVVADANGWRLLPGVDFTGGNLITPHAGVKLEAGTKLPGGVTLNYDVPLAGLFIGQGTVVPVEVALAQPLTIPAGTVLSAAILNPDGSVAHAAGTILRQDLTLAANMKLAPGALLPVAIRTAALIWPAGVPLPGSLDPATSALANMVTLSGAVTLPRGALIPSGSNVVLAAGVEYVDLRPRDNGMQGLPWALAPMLAEGSQSWSLRLVGGADLGAADTRTTQLGEARGNLVLADSHYGMFGYDKPGNYRWTQQAADDFGMPELVDTVIDEDFVRDMVGYPDSGSLCLEIPSYCQPNDVRTYDYRPATARFSVLRTGTGDLDLLAGGNLDMRSLYGVYTAGASSVATQAGDPYNRPRVVGVKGKVTLDGSESFEPYVDGGSQSVYRAWYPDGGGNLTLRVGGNLTGDVMRTSEATYGRPLQLSQGYNSEEAANWLWRQGTGAAPVGEAVPTAWWINFGTYATRGSGGADELLGFTGFGTLGGGNLSVGVDGDAGILQSQTMAFSLRHLNARSQALTLAIGSTGRVLADGTLALTGGGDLDLRVGGRLNPIEARYGVESGGAITNLRGQTQLQALSIGHLEMLYNLNAERDTRAVDRYKPALAVGSGGLTLAPGDSAMQILSLGDLSIERISDPGRGEAVRSAFRQADGTLSPFGGSSWFSLWTAASAIDLFSAGGNLLPFRNQRVDNDGLMVLPSQLGAVAAGGNIYYQGDAVLAPGARGRLDLLAVDSIYGGGKQISRSGAAPSAIASLYQPGFLGWIPNEYDLPKEGPTSLSPDGSQGEGVLFAFGPGSTAIAGTTSPSRFYAMEGDLVGLSSGRQIRFGTDISPTGRQWQIGHGPVRMLAGRDIVGSGSLLGSVNSFSGAVPYTYTDNLFLHGDAHDVSTVRAGRDILYGNFTVGGPGTLEISAGRNILMEGQAAVISLGPILAGDARPGASIVMQAGLGAAGADYAGFLKRYLDGSRVADPARPLTDQGMPFKTYEAELLLWLTQAYGFAGSTADARAYFDALPPEQQRIFARQVYFAELRAGGREYGDKASPRVGSYLRGRQAIAALFPGQDAPYQGAITLYGAGGIQSRNGGDIQVLTPGGAQVYGVEGVAPPASAGVVTQGSGNIQLYAQDSILLGQSRIMTTFGGDILAWSAQGDINAGRGAKTTVVYTPPRRVYDAVGNISLSPAAPGTGAGIATLATLAEVPAGDVDLYAPLGTIDAGEAGIRVSGNVNIAAQNVLNAANIKAKGDSVGIPVTATVNTGALTSASAAASSAVSAAQDSAQRSQNQARQNQPSIINVQILGYGAEPVAGATAPATPQEVSSYRPNNMVQVVGDGALTPAQLARLSQEEKQAFGL